MNQLLQTTFTIPCKITDEWRLKNLKLVLSYLRYHFETNIILCEQDTELAKELCKEFNVMYLQYKSIDEEHLFHQARLQNILYNEVKTPIAASHDLDILFSINQYLASEKYITSSTVDAIYPYDGRFLHVPEELTSKILESMSIDTIDINKCKCVSTVSFGGSLFFNLEMYKKCGLDNENFISWGSEDQERKIRITKLGYKLARVQGPLYHFYHPPTPFANFNNDHYQHNQQELMRIYNTPKEALEEWVKTWKPSIASM